MRRQRDWRRGNRIAEPRTAPRQIVHHRRPRLLVAVCADAIGTQRVDGDDDKIAWRGEIACRRRRRRIAARGHCHHRRD
jgi:hypothetical protein